MKKIIENKQTKHIKHKKIWIVTGSILALFILITAVNVIYRKISSIPSGIYGTWYEYDENTDEKSFLEESFSAGKFIIKSNNTIAYYKNGNEESVEYFTDAVNHSKASIGRLLLPYGIYTFNFPSFKIHKLSDIKVENGILTMNIDNKKHIFYKDKASVISQYLMNFYGVKSGREYFYTLFDTEKIQKISYVSLIENISKKDKCIIVFSKYADYKIISYIEEELKKLINASEKEWYFIDGEKLSDDDKKLLSGSEISAYLNEDLYGIYVPELTEPAVIVTDGTNNPEVYKVSTEMGKLIEAVNK